MSGFEIIGLISGILTILDTVSKLYSVVENAESLPLAFREIARRLPLVQDTLRSAEGYIKQNDADGMACAAIKPIVESCKGKAERLRDVLQEMAPGANDSRLQRYRLAIRTLGKSHRVEELMKGMLEDAHLLAGNRAVKAATEAQVGELLRAMRELSEAPPSVPDAGRSPTFAHYGTGHQFNNAGSGTQSINTSDGKQFVACTMTFGQS
ncbi:SesA protein [Dactylonectria macrodidyma]|uniref:SesA protein n=1 Tax=Dactylonectria macrodidyma TaxID=307937 RepID=A0A9P9IVX5_9HYPO|nr:SesA protein [Dactylonectria macrodidyma]